MEFLFNPSLQIFALFFAGFSLIGVLISLVIFLVEYLFTLGRRLKSFYNEMQEKKKMIQGETEVIAHILLPDESPHTTENIVTVGEQESSMDEDILDENDKESKETSDSTNTEEIGIDDTSEDIDLDIGGYKSTSEQDEYENREVSDEDEISTDDEGKKEIIEEEDFYERIKKPVKTSLQGDIFVSNQPHTTLDATKENEQKESSSISDTPSDELIGEIHLHISRGDYAKAHPLIIEGLSFDRDHKILNIALAEVYESESDYHRAEILYADIIRKHGKDADLLARLALMLSFAGKYQTSYELYQEAYILDNTSDEVISMLLNLSALLGDYRASKEFAEIYLKKYPRHIDTLEVQAKNALELRDGVLFDRTISTLRSLAGFDARTHARVADLMEERSTIGELYYNDKFPE
ncbi:MAG: hypothetical protein U0518_02895 [Candidatus Gracilibacteria bacterium]